MTVLSNQSHPVATLSDPSHRQVEVRPGVVRTGNDGPFIAAAPDLYAALDSLMRLGTLDDQPAIDAARAALAKARGETP
jgi:hypothetical protein